MWLQNPGGHYALAGAYDASADQAYQLSPVGTKLKGTFEGLGNAISNLRILDDGGSGASYINIGLFASTAGGSRISNLNLVDATISVAGDRDGWAGALVGEGSGTLMGDSATGTVTALQARAGGLAGEFGRGSIVHCTADVDVTASEAGGLVGYDGATVSRSAAYGRVSASKGSKSVATAGGLIGLLYGMINRSYATGRVSGATILASAAWLATASAIL